MLRQRAMRMPIEEAPAAFLAALDRMTWGPAVCELTEPSRPRHRAPEKPASAAKRARSAAPREEVPPMRLEPLVLVVEDDGDTRQSVRQLLEEEGYSVEEAVDGRAALDRLERAPRPAMILLDLMMPVMNGQSLLRELEARPALAALPVVVMTASSVDEATSTLTVPMLRKPISDEALLRVVEQYSPRFWDDDEVTTEAEAVVVADSRRDTAKHVCALCCREKAVTRCTACGEAYCQTCFATGSVGVCPRCAMRRDRA